MAIDRNSSGRSAQCESSGGHRWGAYPKPYPIFDAVIWEKVRRCSRCLTVEVQKFRTRK